MNFANIKYRDIADGPGVRVALFVSGCTHHCPGCFNAEAQAFDYGMPFTEDVEEQILQALAPSFIDGLTLLGGEPMEKCNQASLLPFLQKVRTRYPEKNIWCYTGYTYESDLLAADGSVHTPDTLLLLSLIDVLVDGEYIAALRDISLLFRGSSNQRLIDLRASEAAGKIIEWQRRY